MNPELNKNPGGPEAPGEQQHQQSVQQQQGPAEPQQPKVGTPQPSPGMASPTMVSRGPTMSPMTPQQPLQMQMAQQQNQQAMQQSQQQAPSPHQQGPPMAQISIQQPQQQHPMAPPQQQQTQQSLEQAAAVAQHQQGMQQIQLIQQPQHNQMYVQQVYNPANGQFLLQPANMGSPIQSVPNVLQLQSKNSMVPLQHNKLPAGLLPTTQVIASPGKPFQHMQFTPQIITAQGKQMLQQGQTASYPSYATIPSSSSQTLVLPMGVLAGQPNLISAAQNAQQAKQDMSKYKFQQHTAVSKAGVQQQGVMQQPHLITTQAPMINSQGQIVNPIQHYQVYNHGMPQGIWTSGNLPQNTVLQSAPVYIRSMQADGSSLFIPQNAPQQSMQQHNPAAAAAMQHGAPGNVPGTPAPPPPMQQKPMRPEVPANIQPKITQRNLLPSDIRPSVSTQTAGAQAKQQGGKIRQKMAPRVPVPGRPAKGDEFQQKMQQIVDPQQPQPQPPQHQQHQQQQIVFNNNRYIVNTLGPPTQSPMGPGMPPGVGVAPMMVATSVDPKSMPGPMAGKVMPIALPHQIPKILPPTATLVPPPMPPAPPHMMMAAPPAPMPPVLAPPPLPVVPASKEEAPTMDKETANVEPAVEQQDDKEVKDDKEMNGDVEMSEDVKDKGRLKAMVKPQPHILTHVIEGFVIQEASEPFMIARHQEQTGQISDKENHVNGSVETDQVGAAVRNNLAVCEFCHKTDVANKFKKSKRFCSTSCSKRYNVSFSKRCMGEDGASPAKKPATETDLKNPSANTATNDLMGASPAHGGADDNSVSESLIPIHAGSNPMLWSVKEVCDFVQSLPGCAEFAEDFRLQEIDGQALMLLKADHLMSAMSIRLGPALKICSKIEQLRALVPVENVAS
ncbi:polyhomeotic-like protein 2 isoform X5 [Neocloeon triangulifer]|uniref:polyhomeotic-like protein 2 isoform X5 n=1 Tax=Neocloeon triangulifer TaxID=2078957 RepID=UPI00286EC2DE|nr:polyhomeotic-like protein 2 isoform X5 [Neocloeon triangulifer]